MARIKDLKRLCKASDNCGECLFKCNCSVIELPDNADEIVDQWVKEHPQRTYKQDFLEKFPNCSKKIGDIPALCRNTVYGIGTIRCTLEKSCSDCWNEEMEDSD